MIKPIAVDIPYPNTECIQPDYESAVIISSAYAGLHGELSAVLQYVYHHYFFDYCQNEEIADVLIGISITEMRHFEMLGKTLFKLGVDPVFSWRPPSRANWFNTSSISYSKTTQKMLMDDITGELSAISEYEKMLMKLKNEQVQALISRILLDEELHVKVLRGLFEKTR